MSKPAHILEVSSDPQFVVSPQTQPPTHEPVDGEESTDSALIPVAKGHQAQAHKALLRFVME